MNLLISTPPRSGSTLLFNMCRLLLEQIHGKENTYATWVQFFQEKKQKNYNIVKIHDDEDKYIKWSTKIFTCVRDLRYIVASYSEFSKKFNINNPENLKNACNSFVQKMENNSKISNYVFKYESFFEDQVKSIINVANALELPIKKIDVSSILTSLEEIKNKKYEKYDRETTHMHPNHISSKFSADITQRITQEQICFIENNFSWFFKKHGYKTNCLIKMM
jgi:hypothetical protein